MLKWFEQVETERPNIVCSRIRLVRNWDAYEFPAKLTDQQSREMIDKLEYGLKDLTELDGKKYVSGNLEELDELTRLALRERRLLNNTLAEKKSPAGIMLSEDESSCLVFNGDDHIRIQLLSTGFHLEELWTQADQMDDYINARFNYAYDDKYGYLTSFPTNVGTGLRASVMVHLPALSLGKRFNSLLSDMSRFGTSVKGVYGEENENDGSLYVISNQKTLGQTEKEIVEIVNKVAGELVSQENQVRELSIQKHKLSRADEAYKSYGVLKYARKLSRKDAMNFLSQLMAGITDELIKTEKPCSIYRMMLGIQPANLQKISDRPLDKAELDVARANYIRMELPELV